MKYKHSLCLYCLNYILVCVCSVCFLYAYAKLVYPKNTLLLIVLLYMHLGLFWGPYPQNMQLSGSSLFIHQIKEHENDM